jgi:hypothetical protein
MTLLEWTVSVLVICIIVLSVKLDKRTQVSQ